MKKITSLILMFAFMFLPLDIFALSARSAVVLDAASGRVLYNHNKDEKRGMASTTKIMTALCALNYGNPEELVSVSSTAAGVEGSSMYLAQGEKITLSDLTYGLMLVSGNDAATAIAESISGSVENFSLLMNKTAEEIGAFNTHFQNPHGLSDKEHYTTAHDLAKITAFAMKNPVFCEIVSTKSKTLPKTDGGYQRHLVNHNKFLNMYEGCIGVKTGFTKATGRCLVTAAEKNGLRLICVTLNAPDDWNDHKIMYDNAFSAYSPYKINDAGNVVCLATVKNGTVDTVELTTSNTAYIPITEGEEALITSSPEVFEDIAAPIEKGDVLGSLAVKKGSETIAEFPLVAKGDIQERKFVFKPKNIDVLTTFKKMCKAWLLCFK